MSDRPAGDRPPRDSLVRAILPGGAEFRAKGEGSDSETLGVLAGHFSVFNRWTEINSYYEGNFLERIAPGAFKKTFSENRDGMRVLFNHGSDPSIGDKVLGSISDIREDPEGAFYEVDLFDTSYNRDLLPGLRAKQYGASFRFRVVKEEFVQKPAPSESNPRGLPERTIKEAQVMEFGPVTFPAYPDATAGMRSISMTDEYLRSRLGLPTPTERREVAPIDDADEATAAEDGSRSDDQAETSAESSRQDGEDRANVDEQQPEGGALDDGAGADHSDASRGEQPDEQPEKIDPNPDGDRSATAPEPTGKRTARMGMTIDERTARQDEIERRLSELHREYGADQMPDEQRAEWAQLIKERGENAEAIAEYEVRAAEIAGLERDARRTELSGRPSTRRGSRSIDRVPSNIWAIDEYRTLSSTTQELRQAFRDGAMRAVEQSSFPHENVTADEARQRVQFLVDHVDDENATLAQRMIATGSPLYQRAFGKTVKALSTAGLSGEEARALSLGTDGAGGYAVPFQLDPTVILTSDGVVNPLRQLARVESIVGKEWDGVASAGITVSRDAEAAEVSDDSPVLTQPKVTTKRVQGFVPFSVELDSSWARLQSEVARLLADAKDSEEASSFTLGDGTGNNANGLIATMSNTSHVTTASAGTFAAGDLYTLEEALPPRFRARAQFAGNKAIYNKVRQFDTAGGAALWVRLADATGPELIGYRANELSSMSSTVAASELILAFGDFKNFLIVDRIGMTVELVPHLFGANGRPTGQRGIYAVWMNNSLILTPKAFRLLKVHA